METIDLDEVQRRIEAQRGVSAPTSRGLLPKPLIAVVWQVMTSMYGTLFTNRYGIEVDPDNVWRAALYGLDEDGIKRGFRACVDQAMKFPPTAPEFRGLCLGSEHWEHARMRAAATERALPRPPIDYDAGKQRLAEIRELLKGAA